MQDTIFADFADMWPEKFQNKTNGVTQRRWLAFCNPPLRALLSEALGGQRWITDLTEVTVRQPPGPEGGWGALGGAWGLLTEGRRVAGSGALHPRQGKVDAGQSELPWALSTDAVISSCASRVRPGMRTSS